ncbi:MAG: ABC transporter permease subunit [Actinomycetota bacterium]|nr:ABC transporter permease subunit [Actinomycetota bacterium]MDP9475032.1 ABC transporter permease subunit [Actinomycetota bacterium]
MGKRRGDFGLVIVAALVALPFVPLVLWTFAGEWRFPDLLPAEWSLRGIRYLLDPGNGVLGATLISLLVGVSVALASVAVGLPAGMALGGYEWRFKGIVIFFILLPILVPPLASTMGIHLTFIRLGLTDTVLGVFLVHLVPTVPYTAIIMTSIFVERTGELEEVARTLGAGPWQTFLHVTLPAAAPGVAVAGLFAFLISWGQYILTLLIGGGNVVSLPMLLFSAASGNDPVITSALALAFAVPAILALVIALRYLKPLETDRGRGFLGLGKVS